ncbi:MAG: O-antigen ligase family protein [Acetatifactor sp.]|nr:O-antigen ligase family protein [Acetatifactor sp.]
MQDRDEFSRLLCGLYIVVLAVVLPLYTKGTYWQLGDTKYFFFRNVTVFCLGVWILSVMVEKCRGLWQDRLLRGGLGVSGRRQGGRCAKLSSMDCCMLLYGACVLLSASLSAYGSVAWTGYREWYMGAFSQLLFVGIYFFVSRSWKENVWPLYLWDAAFFIVIALGLGQKLGRDVMGFLAENAIWDWEYSHMLSTVGNINWFCGYCSVAIAVPAAGYLGSGNRVETVLLYPVTAAGLLLMCIQGSDAGVVMAGLCLGLGLFWGRKDSRICRRTLALAAGVILGLPAYGHLALRTGQRAAYSLPSDGFSLGELTWKGWYLAGGICLALCVLSFVLERNACRRGEGSQRARRAQKAMAAGAWILLMTGLLAMALLYLSRQPFGANWGNGRGTLWSLSWRGFLQSGWKGKLIGAGPDCFAEYIYGTFPPEEMLSLIGRWAGAIFANAHNEWLNQLVNTGILGVCCYGGIFFCGAVRYRKDMAGLMALALYTVNSLVSFQQVMNAPLLFLILGICESRRRRRLQDENRNYGKECPPGAGCPVRDGQQVQN